MAQVSIIVPVYKVENYLRRCIDSILAQTYTDFELILVDDGSPDHSGTICDEYKNIDKRIVVIHKENGGVSDARNTGLDWASQNSKSEWINFIDSDDWVHPCYLEALVNSVQNNKTSIGACMFTECTERSKHPKDVEIHHKYITGEEFCVNQWVYSNAPWAKLIPKSCFTDIRFPEGIIHEDAFVMYKILLPCKRLAFVNAALYCYNLENSDSILRKPWSPERLVLLDAIEERIQFCIENGFTGYLNTEIDEYIKTIRFYIYKIDQLGYQEYKNGVLTKLRKMLKTDHFKEKFSWRRNMDIFELAYPKTTHILYFLSRVKRKITKR